MPLFEHGDIRLEVDEDGFIQNPDEWTEEIGVALSTTEGVD